MNGIIYMRISPSGKRYVGQTTKAEEHRWKQHVRLAYKGTQKEKDLPLSRAIRKYGPDSFSVEILETGIQTSEKLDEREIYWIKEKHTLISERMGGLNVSVGGAGFRTYTGESFKALYEMGYSLWEIANITGATAPTVSGYLNIDKFEAYSRSRKRAKKKDIPDRKISNYNIYTKEKIKTFSSIYEAARYYTKCSNPADINSLFNGTQKSTYGFFWKFDDQPISVIDAQYERYHNGSTRSTHKIAVTNIETKEIFESVSYAAKKYNVPNSQIMSCCRGKRSTAAGFHWIFYEPKCEKHKGIQGHPAAVINVETGEIFRSVLQASKQYNIKYALIDSCCKGMRENAGGYHWHFKDEIPPAYKGTHAKPIICIDTGIIYPSVSEAARQTKISINRITECLKGRREHINGTHWEYKNPADKESGKFKNSRFKPVLCIDTGVIYETIEAAAHAAGVGTYRLRTHLAEGEYKLNGLRWKYAIKRDDAV